MHDVVSACELRPQIFIIAFNEGERTPNLVQAKKFEIFCNRRRRQISPPKIFERAYARPEAGMDFGLAFMTPRPQTVNLACKHNDTSGG